MYCTCTVHVLYMYCTCSVHIFSVSSLAIMIIILMINEYIIMYNYECKGNSEGTIVQWMYAHVPKIMYGACMHKNRPHVKILRCLKAAGQSHMTDWLCHMTWLAMSHDHYRQYTPTHYHRVRRHRRVPWDNTWWPVHHYTWWTCISVRGKEREREREKRKRIMIIIIDIYISLSLS